MSCFVGTCGSALRPSRRCRGGHAGEGRLQGSGPPQEMLSCPSPLFHSCGFGVRSASSVCAQGKRRSLTHSYPPAACFQSVELPCQPVGLHGSCYQEQGEGRHLGEGQELSEKRGTLVLEAPLRRLFSETKKACSRVEQQPRSRGGDVVLDSFFRPFEDTPS